MIIKEIIENRYCLNKRAFFTIILLLYFFGISALFQNTGFSGIIKTAAYALYIGCVICYSNKIVRDADDIFALGMGAFLGIIVSILTTDNSLISVYSGDASSRIRVYGGFAHPNTFGATAMSVCICMILSCFYGSRGTKNKIFMLIIALISGYFCYLSDSSSAIYGTFFFIALMIYFRLLKKIKSPGWINFILTIMVLGFLISYMVREVDYTKILIRVNSLSSIQFNNMQQFLIGDGLAETSERGMWGAEFALTTVLLKTGVLGMVVFALIFAAFYLRSRRLENRDIFNAVFFTFMLTCIAEAYITNITNTYPFVMWILMSAASNGIALNDGNSV